MHLSKHMLKRCQNEGLHLLNKLVIVSDSLGSE